MTLEVRVASSGEQRAPIGGGENLRSHAVLAVASALIALAVPPFDAYECAPRTCCTDNVPVVTVRGYLYMQTSHRQEGMCYVIANERGISGRRIYLPFF